MKCNNCNKQIPSVSTVCPYCSSPVDPNYRPPVDFGSIEGTDYDKNSNDLKAYIQEPKNRKVVVIGLVVVIVIVGIFALLILSMIKPKKETPIEYFINTINSISENIYDNFLGSNYASSGEYKLYISVNEAKSEFNGKYERDVKSRILKIDGIMRDPNENSGGVILDSKDFEFTSYMKDNQLYFKSEQIFNDYLNFKFNDNTGLLTTKNYNLDILVSGLEDALKHTLVEMPILSADESINYRGDEAKTKKYYIKFDNENKVKFLTKFYTELVEDANFVNEYARIKGMKSDDTIEYLNNQIKDAEFRYSGKTEEELILSVYTIRKDIIRFGFEINTDKTKKLYQLDIKNDKYYFDYFVDNDSKLTITLHKTEEVIAEINNITYTATCDFENYNIDIKLLLKVNERTLVKKEEIKSFKEFGTISETDKDILKNNLKYYTNDVSFVDKLADSLKEKCVLGIECNCPEGKDVCSCLVDGKLITCDKDRVKEKPVETPSEVPSTTN